MYKRLELTTSILFTLLLGGSQFIQIFIECYCGFSFVQKKVQKRRFNMKTLVLQRMPSGKAPLEN